MPAKPGFRGAERGRECRRNPSRLAVRKKLQDMKKKKKGKNVQGHTPKGAASTKQEGT